MPSKTAQEKLRASWSEERQSSYLYGILAEVEKGTPREKLFRELARMAEVQADHWKRIAGGGEAVATWSFEPGLKVNFVTFLIRTFGPRRIKPILAAVKVRGLSVYSGGRHPLAGHEKPQSVSEIGSRHRVKGSGNLRASVFGINDGLVSNASLILGVAAAGSHDPRLIIMSGGAGLLAGALSMASGEYVSVRSQRELLEYQLGLERAELEEYPEEEAAELALIYEARGLSKSQATELSRNLIADPERALDALAREELGLDPTDLGSPWGAAVSSFVSFSIGGFIPLVPFLISRSGTMLGYSVGLTAAALFATGAFVSLFSGKGFLWSGVRMLLIGGGAGLISYLIGGRLGG